ncbi:hypothetical protein MANES_12G000800v8 [Manihot esculenta]|uniref:Uncharacterized protein n=4 Tax=Manihot esculenta TaxID=3983 RepID=A0ACB7GNJ1_MANES|nr:hypothetical protein MANES_12G000800v8 [Manihot esculenta]KAG8641519.1 hypothetical protein MANES_12G000800v8 [Manihot esculenta]KAG8641520.1 hypothetical protein MANES_12G000800v8 [Manihot esculenta]KAG8641521.1 hypothetical protein MANES_12G000800v8 [Manihot esculenta]
MKGSEFSLNGRKDRDEDLLLFKELHKREKDRLVSLLQPVSDEFEPSSGNCVLYKIASSKKGSGYELFGEKGKNDYDWLKTPPATPLFPSLEMEANAPQLVVQREISIVQPLSRFADNTKSLKGSIETPKSPNSKPNIPLRSVTPASRRSSISSTETRNVKVTSLLLNQKKAQSTADRNKRTNMATNTPKSTNQKETQTNLLAKNITLSATGPDSNKTKPFSRGRVSPLRSIVPNQIPGFSNDTPPNLRTDRATSATRGRLVVSNLTLTLSVHQKPEPTLRSRRQSCSPSVMRGRKESEGKFITQKGKTETGNNNGTQIVGSRIVEKVMNIRKLIVEEREAKAPKPQTAPAAITSNGSSSGFGRIISKTSGEMAHKHMVRTRGPQQ